MNCFAPNGLGLKFWFICALSRIQMPDVMPQKQLRRANTASGMHTPRISSPGAGAIRSPQEVTQSNRFYELLRSKWVRIKNLVYLCSVAYSNAECDAAETIETSNRCVCCAYSTYLN